MWPFKKKKQVDYRACPHCGGTEENIEVAQYMPISGVLEEYIMSIDPAGYVKPCGTTSGIYRHDLDIHIGLQYQGVAISIKWPEIPLLTPRTAEKRACITCGTCLGWFGKDSIIQWFESLLQREVRHSEYVALKDTRKRMAKEICGVL